MYTIYAQINEYNITPEPGFHAIDPVPGNCLVYNMYLTYRIYFLYIFNG